MNTESDLVVNVFDPADVRDKLPRLRARRDGLVADAEAKQREADQLTALIESLEPLAAPGDDAGTPASDRAAQNGHRSRDEAPESFAEIAAALSIREGGPVSYKQVAEVLPGYGRKFKSYNSLNATLYSAARTRKVIVRTAPGFYIARELAETGWEGRERES
jgi:hypothetical protein